MILVSPQTITTLGAEANNIQHFGITVARSIVLLMIMMALVHERVIALLELVRSLTWTPTVCREHRH
jgi:hypothetical protein